MEAKSREGAFPGNAKERAGLSLIPPPPHSLRLPIYAMYHAHITNFHRVRMKESILIRDYTEYTLNYISGFFHIS